MAQKAISGHRLTYLVQAFRHRQTDYPKSVRADTIALRAACMMVSAIIANAPDSTALVGSLTLYQIALFIVARVNHGTSRTE